MTSRTLESIYEINTAVYLEKLSRTQTHAITLGTIPDEELQRIAKYGCDAVWLMGIWKRSRDAIEVALHDQTLLDEARKVLPDLRPSDIIGSAYAIGAYEINEAFGNEAELAQLRARLAQYGLKLILDFVPNHTAFDHDWISEHPEYYISGSPWNRLTHPSWYRKQGAAHIARGRDPHFKPWSDVAQLNAFASGYRHASIETLLRIASLCDGVRCDMAMLLTNSVFTRTWNAQAGTVPSTEYWQEVIGAVRQTNQQFTFIAECYWDMQSALIEQGFDYCYDKDIYDHLVARDELAAQTHANAQLAISDHLVHFLENHDEPRAAVTFDLDAHRVSLEFLQSLPGPKLWHDGQFEGFRVKLPVQIGRGPIEQVDQAITEMYRIELQK